MVSRSTFQRRRAQHALDRQLQYQQQKSRALAGHEADVTTHMMQSSTRVREVLRQWRPISDNASVLEVGSGAHGLIFYFGVRCAVGVDPLAHHYSSLFSGWQRRVSTIAACGESLPFGDHSFEVVLCDNVVDHAESPSRIVAEISRVLIPGGVLYFSVNVHHPLYWLASGVHGAWHRAGIDFNIATFADHTVHLTLTGARELFAGQPLTILEETANIEAVKTRAKQMPPRHMGDRLKRVFFKNALYEVVAVRT